VQSCIQVSGAGGGRREMTRHGTRRNRAASRAIVVLGSKRNFAGRRAHQASRSSSPLVASRPASGLTVVFSRFGAALAFGAATATRESPPRARGGRPRLSATIERYAIRHAVHCWRCSTHHRRVAAARPGRGVTGAAAVSSTSARARRVRRGSPASGCPAGRGGVAARREINLGAAVVPARRPPGGPPAVPRGAPVRPPRSAPRRSADE
jgi:hypothetical protein